MLKELWIWFGIMKLCRPVAEQSSEKLLIYMKKAYILNIESHMIWKEV